MKQGIYTLRDKLTDYGLPFFQPSDEVAKRSLIQLASGNGEYAKISEDIEVYKIGIFDTELGTIEPMQHEYLGLLRDYKKGDNI